MNVVLADENSEEFCGKVAKEKQGHECDEQRVLSVKSVVCDQRRTDQLLIVRNRTSREDIGRIGIIWQNTNTSS